MPTCCAPGCTSGYDSRRRAGRHFFQPPQDPELSKAWEEAIPRAEFHLTATSKVCDLHFKSSDIIKNYEHKVEGQTVLIPSGKWLLKKDAVPSVFSSPPLSLQFKPATKKKGEKCSQHQMNRLAPPMVTKNSNLLNLRRIQLSPTSWPKSEGNPILKIG
ncbi:hypothetical protein HPB47_019556, partial [Ixodes persulcatus]